MTAKFVLVLLFAFLSFFNVSALPAKNLTIGLDVSGSSPLSVPVFAQAAAKEIHRKIASLQPNDIVFVRTIGDRGLANLPFKAIRIDRRNRPKEVAEKIARYIWNLPSNPPEAQGSTNLIAFLQYGRDFGCASGGELWLITDGLESSEYIKAKDLLSGKRLPQPKSKFLAGCSVSMYGFGQNAKGALPIASVEAMQGSWETFMKAAGASSFNVIVNP